MPPFDPKHPPAWVKRMLDAAAKADGEHFWAEAREGDGGSSIISLGHGTFVAPLPVGWSLHPARVCEGHMRVKEGYDVAYRLDIISTKNSKALRASNLLAPCRRGANA